MTTRRVSRSDGIVRSLATDLGVPPHLAEPAGDRADAALMEIKRAYESGDGGLRGQHLMQAQQHIAALNPGRHRGLINHLQARVLELQGRGHDTRIAHLTPGEMVIPHGLQTARLQAVLQTEARRLGYDPHALSVSTRRNSINPHTGQIEFNDDGLGGDDDLGDYVDGDDTPLPGDTDPNIGNSSYYDENGNPIPGVTVTAQAPSSPYNDATQGVGPRWNLWGDPDAQALNQAVSDMWNSPLPQNTDSGNDGTGNNSVGAQTLPNAHAPSGTVPSVIYKPGVPTGSPAIQKFLQCLAGCTDQTVRATSTSELIPQHGPNDPHRRGLAVDVTVPGPASTTMQCGANCGALYQQNEYTNPSANATGGGHYHFQLIPGRGGATGPYYPNTDR